MLTLNNLKSKSGTHRSSRRIGRGTGSGRGSTAGHGNNGSKARTGDKYKFYFEGGQTPLTRSVSKRGFVHALRIEWQIVNICEIEKLATTEKEIDLVWLLEKGLIKNQKSPVKILGDGEISKPLAIKAHAFSKSAKDKLEKIKGKAEVIVRG